MKTKKPKEATQKRNQYSPQFKEQALEAAGRQGVPTVAADLGIAEGLLYSWRTKRQQTGRSFEEQKLQQAELAQLKRDIERLRQENEFLKKAAAYFAKQPK